MQELKKHPASFEYLMQQLDAGYVHLSQILQADLTEFDRVPYSVIQKMNESRDPVHISFILEALEEYYIQKDCLYFNFFDSFEVLQFADRYTYRFGAYCSDVNTMMDWYERLQHYFPSKNKGVCTESYSFSPEHLLPFVVGDIDTPLDAVREYWNFDTYTVMLEYGHHTENELQLSFFTFEPLLDYSIRQKGSILDLLPFRVPTLLYGKTKGELQSFTVKHLDPKESTITNIEFDLEARLFESFDKINILQHADEVDIECNTAFDVQFYADKLHNCFQAWEFVDMLIHLYGSDSEGNGRLLIQDPADIIEHQLLVYRHWKFNQHHGLYNEHDPKQKLVYEVILEKESGHFQLSIQNYHQLLEHFGDGIPIGK
ncbi:MAG: hypothetical protein OIF50_01785 [Flavobacteriaceae bacterium]|nr:hypothetical protein [Flavobacteriaceae bacterium]